MRAYLRRGLRGDAKRLAEWASAAGVADVTVLEVGGGVGAIQAELLREARPRGR
jgi:16S rRNA A1518/A1519 N6-dimethyltransferase RsmA/KsgA/DIM1 with predicted DNA glycosylase/AP lyase activity